MATANGLFLQGNQRNQVKIVVKENPEKRISPGLSGKQCH
jgi:hypothetical protein